MNCLAFEDDKAPRMQENTFLGLECKILPFDEMDDANDRIFMEVYVKHLAGCVAEPPDAIVKRINKTRFANFLRLSNI